MHVLKGKGAVVTGSADQAYGGYYYHSDTYYASLPESAADSTLDPIS